VPIDPVDPAAMPLASELPAARPEVAVPSAPAHGLFRLLGAGTPTIGLMPALPSSVAPSGIVPPLSCGRPRLDVPVPTDVDCGEAVPKVDGVVGVTQLPLDITPAAVPLSPPPSKDEFAPPVELPVIDEPPVVLLGVQAEALFIVLLGTGLIPPGSISVAPSGMPVPVAPLEPGMPSGEVAPMPGVLIAVCA